MATTNQPFILDGFDYATLCKAAVNAPLAQGPISELGLFAESGVMSTEVQIESINNQITLVKSSLRGGPVNVAPITGRSLIKLKIPHLVLNSTVLADAWIDRAGFGTGVPAHVLTERDRILAEHKAALFGTIEYHKARALQGQILDTDGSILTDLHAEFGIVQHVVSDALVTGANVANKVIAARRLAEAELGSSFAKTWVMWCSASFIDSVRAHPSFVQSVAGWSSNGVLTSDHRSGDLFIGGVVLREVADIGGKEFIPADTAFLTPVGVPNLCNCWFGPSPYVEAVGEVGLPIYARSEPLPLGKGLILESSVNPLPVVTRPKAVIKVTA